MKALRLKFPATSANLGPGFDTLALALGLFLEIEAFPAREFSIEAEGRNPELCGSVERNLVLETYRAVLQAEGRPSMPLALRVSNGIPLGMGCGSSAAARLAGTSLAAHFGNLGWSSERIVAVAADREGHPDNVAACWHGGLTIAAGGEKLSILSISPPPGWRAVLVLPSAPVATEESRRVLPLSYDRADVVANLQSTALLIGAFVQRRGDLLARATADRLHQPFRSALCPLFPNLAPLAGHGGVLSVTLSGAGPSVLLVISEEADAAQVASAIELATGSAAATEVLEAPLWAEGASVCPIG